MMEFNLKLILTATLLIISQISINIIGYANSNEEKELKGKRLRKLDYEEIFSNPLTEWNKNYERTIRAIKKQEGFASGKPYICPAGYPTIGYGHLIKEGESFAELSEKQADSLLRVDFNKSLVAVESSIKLEGNKKLAIAHFVFTKGIGAFNKSELRQKIINGEKIDEELIKHCYYINQNGERIKSQHALNIRKWELRMFNLDS
jgi:lysozyme